MDLVFPAVRSRDRLIIGFNEKVFKTHGTDTYSNVTGTWGPVAQAPPPPAMEISSLYAAPNMLYAGTWSNHWHDHGAEIWKTSDGLNWGSRTFPDPNEYGVIGMTEFHGQLYAATENINEGFRIWRLERDPIENLYWWHVVMPRRSKITRTYGFVQNPILVATIV